MFRSISITLTLCITAFATEAALLGRAALTPGGTDYQAYYDDALNITWLADANLAATNDFGLSATSDAADIQPDGSMRWNTATQWVAAMNAATYLGANSWRLPDIDFELSNLCYWGPCEGSEMSDLYYSTLGNIGSFTGSTVNGSDVVWNDCPGEPENCLVNTGPFLNLQPDRYWTGTLYAPPDTKRVYSFSFRLGIPSIDWNTAMFSRHNFAWAVHSGDIDLIEPVASWPAPYPTLLVPIPPAVLLFGSALGVMGWMRRKISS